MVDETRNKLLEDILAATIANAGESSLIFAPSGTMSDGDFLVTEEGAGNDSVRVASGKIDLIIKGVVTNIELTSDFIISHGDGLPTSGTHKIIALPYQAGDESFVNTANISLFVAPSNEVTIAVVNIDINILGRGTFDISSTATQDYRQGIELTKLFYASGNNLLVSGRPYSIFDKNDAAVERSMGNITSDHGCEAYDDGGTIKYRTTKNAIVNRRAVAPVGGTEVEQYATDDIFLGMWRDKAKTIRGLAIRGQVLGLVDAQGQVDYAPNTDFLAGGQYEQYWNFIDQTDEGSPSQAATWTAKAANKWSLMVLCEFAGSANLIMCLGKDEYDTADIDAAADTVYAVDWNLRSADLNIVGAFLVQSGASLTLADIVQVPASKINITQ
jgi:hypothetical protein